MVKKKKGRLYNLFDSFSNKVSKAAGSPIAFLSAAGIIVLWGVTGPIFGFSDTWQLIINTGTTIITFLMVFLIQQSQNKDTVALHMKLNELIAASKDASNRLIDSEDLTDDELQTIKKYYVKLSSLALKERNLFKTHSVDEAEKDNQQKAKVQNRAASTEKTTRPKSGAPKGNKKNTDTSLNQRKAKPSK